MKNESLSGSEEWNKTQNINQGERRRIMIRKEDELVN